MIVPIDWLNVLTLYEFWIAYGPSLTEIFIYELRLNWAHFIRLWDLLRFLLERNFHPKITILRMN